MTTHSTQDNKDMHDTTRQYSKEHTNNDTQHEVKLKRTCCGCSCTGPCAFCEAIVKSGMVQKIKNFLFSPNVWKVCIESCKRNFNTKNLIQRVISSIILMPIVLYCVYSGGKVYCAMVACVALIGLAEWIAIVHNGKHDRQHLWQLDMYVLGFVYACTFCWAMFFLRSQERGLLIVLWCLSVTWATDIGAYLVGSFIRGPKLAPVLSANKTWAGFFGGVACSTIIGVLFQEGLLDTIFNHTIMLSVVLSISAQCGDLKESWFKRKFGVKNSSNLIPGHGGMLDRVDGLVVVVIIVAVMRYFSHS